MNATSGAQSLVQLAYNLPGLLVYLAGLLLAGIYRARYGRVATLVLIGCATLLLTTFLGVALQSFVLQRSSAASVASVTQNLAYVNGITILLHAIGVGFLLAAALTGRSSTPES